MLAKRGENELIFIPAMELSSGMRLAKEVVVFYRDPLVLLRSGEILTDRYIQRINQFGVNGVYIEDGIHRDVVPPPAAIDMRTKAEASFRVQALFNNINAQSGGTTTHKIQELDRVMKKLTDALLNNTSVLVDIADLKAYDDCTYRHSLSVAVLSVAVGLEYGLPRKDLHRLALCAALHDIGKVDIPISIINKPGRLTDEEYDFVKTHPQKGKEYLENERFQDNEIIMGVGCHHERMDGTGYPYGIAGKEIPLFGRIIAVADIYDALTSMRPYRKPMQPAEAAEYLMGNCDSALDIEAVQAFLKRVEMYPIGSCVKLNNGEPAIVVRNNNVLRPVVRLMNPPYTELDLFEDSSLYNTVIQFCCKSKEALEKHSQEEILNSKAEIERYEQERRAARETHSAQ